MEELVRRLRAAGVRITAGSDTMNPFVIPGLSLHGELRMLVETGLSPEEAWQAASRDAGQALGRPELGTLEEGAPADLLIFREDPTRNLAALDTLEAVVAAGRLYPRSTLLAALERQQEHFDSVVYRVVSGAGARLAVAWLSRSET
jgi:imidazolonepropionase-like amidohydrolase